MIDPDEFDAFYKSARARLLLQTYALTGDLPAARAAVRDAFVVAWHHWRKVSRHPDPEGWVRPIAWSHAQRRHTARIWHRDKGLDPEVRATFDALGRLPVQQRRALLLTNLSSVSMGDLAREIGLPRVEAERQLQTAAAQFAVHRDVPTTHIRTLFEPMREEVERVQWPRPTIIRRAGAARRRTHTLVGAAVAMAALVVTGSLVTDADGVRPTLSGAQRPAPESPSDVPTITTGQLPPEEFSADALLTERQVAERVSGRRWSVASTSDNTEGDGLVVPCQQSRFADPRGRAAVVRTFESTARGDVDPATAFQVAELSGSGDAARQAYRSTLGWYAGCLEPRIQLITTKDVDGVADEAKVFVLRAWEAPRRTYVAGVARTGRITTTTLASTSPDAAPSLPAATRLLASAVEGLCGRPGAGTCVSGPRLGPSAPVAAGQVPGMVSEFDLPPVPGVTDPWIGTEPRRAVDNVADTSCDQTDFGGLSNSLTRTFLIPDAKLPDEFGLTETVGTVAPAKARAFVEKVRSRMASCPDRELGTDVLRLAHRVADDRDLSVWRVTTELSDDRTVTFLMGVAREGTAVAQVGFVPTPGVTLGPDAFIALVERASQRLPALPRPR